MNRVEKALVALAVTGAVGFAFAFAALTDEPPRICVIGSAAPAATAAAPKAVP